MLMDEMNDKYLYIIIIGCARRLETADTCCKGKRRIWNWARAVYENAS